MPHSSAERPYSFVVDASARLAYGRMWGLVTGQDMLALIAETHADPAWQNGFDAIWDCSAVTAHVVGPEEVAPIVEEEVASGDGRDTLVESPTVGESALSEMLAAFCRRRGKTMTVYTTLDDALAALGREELPEPMARLRG